VFVAFVAAVTVLAAQRKVWANAQEREPHIPGARPGRSPPQEEERTKIRPLHDRLLVERLEEKEVKKGGIIIPDTAKEKPQEARVIAVGTGKVTDEGKKIPLDVKAGDKILFGKYSGSEVKIDDKEYLIMREEDVLAILE
jgi:chaperonin GroES